MRPKSHSLEIIVGLFMLAGLFAFLLLALKVSGLSDYVRTQGYVVRADFDNIGDLKVRAPVTIAGVRVGEVASITLDPSSFRARVMLKIEDKQDKIPADSSAQILTEGLLGSNYISLTPGYGEDEKVTYLKQGAIIQETHPALILENLIGQLVFSMQKGKEKE